MAHDPLFQTLVLVYSKRYFKVLWFALQITVILLVLRYVSQTQNMAFPQKLPSGHALTVDENVTASTPDRSHEQTHKMFLNMYNKDSSKVVTNVTVHNRTIRVLWYTVPKYLALTTMNKNIRKYCKYTNCIAMDRRSELHSANAIVFPFINPLDTSPPIPKSQRNPNQVWIFFYSECPPNHEYTQYKHENWKNTMNWSMSYELDADIFAPYGSLVTRTTIPSKDYQAIFWKKTKVAAWFVSNCKSNNERHLYVEELQKHGVTVDILGNCGNKTYLRTTAVNELLDEKYMFYLSFENSFCKEYVTEKFFNYFNRDVVLVVRGGLDYDRELPNDTFINTAHFRTPKDLAQYLLKVGSSEKLYTRYLIAKDKYEAIYTDEFMFYPVSYCSICAKLNNLDFYKKSYEDHAAYVHNNKCWNATDIVGRRK